MGNTRYKERICVKCNFTEYVSKTYDVSTRSTGYKKIITVNKSEPRKGRIHAGVTGVKEVIPCSCKGAKEYPDYLNEHRMIPECTDCGNHHSIRNVA